MKTVKKGNLSTSLLSTSLIFSISQDFSLYDLFMTSTQRNKSNRKLMDISLDIKIVFSIHRTKSRNSIKNSCKSCTDEIENACCGRWQHSSGIYCISGNQKAFPDTEIEIVILNITIMLLCYN